jgi:hypothetical protein
MQIKTMFQIPTKGHSKFKSCDSKNKYLNIDEAMIQGKFAMSKCNKQLFTYLCNTCNSWHLTRSKTKYKVI